MAIRILASLMLFVCFASSTAMAMDQPPVLTSDEAAVDESTDASAVAPVRVEEEVVSSQTELKKEFKVETKVEEHSWADPVFGRYQIQVKFHNYPEFDDGLKYYEDLYGKTPRYGMFGADYTPWGWFVNFGFGFRTGMFSDHGNAASEISSATGEVTLDQNGKTTLTLIPFQFLAVARFTPFPKKWLVLEGYGGRERMYFQEIRNVSSSASVIDRSSNSGIVGDNVLTNKGWVSGNVVGAAVSILMNPLDEQSIQSMRHSLGLGFVYLTLFQEKITYVDKDRVSFGRSSSGIGFTFETVN